MLLFSTGNKGERKEVGKVLRDFVKLHVVILLDNMHSCTLFHVRLTPFSKSPPFSTAFREQGGYCY